MLDLLQEEPEVLDEENASDLIITKGHIQFDHVYFSYDPRKPILQDISFQVMPGTMTALVGSSGDGKSTIGRLLFRFYDVHQGTIFIDGQDIRSVSQSSLRKAIGVVPQDSVLFNESIEYNILYGKPNANSDAMINASSAAQVDFFVHMIMFIDT